VTGRVGQSVAVAGTATTIAANNTIDRRAAFNIQSFPKRRNT